MFSTHKQILGTIMKLEGSFVKMAFRVFVKLLLYLFVPTSLLGLFYLTEDIIDIHSNDIAEIIAIFIAPLYLASIGNLIMLDNNIQNKAIKLLIVLLSALATIHAINMLYLSCALLFMPTDGISKMVGYIILSLSLGVLLISYPITNVILSKLRKKFQ